MTNPTRTGARARRAFTLTEMLVVVVVILLVAAVAIPSFQSGLASAERSLAENRFAAAMTVTRDLAVRSADADAAAVFFYEPGVGLRIVPMLQVSRNPLSDSNAGGGTERVERDVFAPVSGAPGFLLPGRYTVRGYAEGAQLGDELGATAPWHGAQWYGGTIEDRAERLRGQWVFPETWAYDNTDPFPGDFRRSARSTFAVRFARGTGAVVQGGNDILGIDPAVFSDGAQTSAELRKDAFESAFGIGSGLGRPGVNAWLRVDLRDDLRAWARNVVTRYPYPSVASPADADELRLSLIGSLSNDTVLARTVSRLALVDETDVIRGVGAARPDPDTGTLYRPYRDPRTGAENWSPGADTFNMGARVFPQGELTQREVVTRISQWIDGDTDFNGEIIRAEPDQNNNDADEPRRARIYTFQTTRGTLMEVVQ